MSTLPDTDLHAAFSSLEKEGFTGSSELSVVGGI